MEETEKIFNYPSTEPTTKCCKCDEIKCYRRQFDGCEHCEKVGYFWLRRLNKNLGPPTGCAEHLKNECVQVPACFVG